MSEKNMMKKYVSGLWKENIINGAAVCCWNNHRYSISRNRLPVGLGDMVCYVYFTTYGET